MQRKAPRQEDISYEERYDVSMSIGGLFETYPSFIHVEWVGASQDEYGARCDAPCAVRSHKVPQQSRFFFKFCSKSVMKQCRVLIPDYLVFV